MPEIIATDNIGGSEFQYRIAKVVRDGLNFQIQVRGIRRTGGFSDWETANMGHYGSKKEALAGFLPRYRNGTFTAVDPTIQAAITRRDKQNAIIQRGRVKEAAAGEIRRKQEDARRQAVTDEFSKAKFTTASASIVGDKGAEIGVATGPSINGLVIAKTSGERRIKDTAFQITHIGTGFAVGPKYDTQREAKIAAFRLSQLADFTKGPKELAKSGIPLGSIANRMKSDALVDFSSALPVVKPKESRLTAKEIKRINEKADAFKPAKLGKSANVRFKANKGISTRAAEARFNNPNAGKTPGTVRRNPAADSRKTAANVAPAEVRTPADLAAQKRWFKRPARSDFQGVDTKRSPKARM